MEDQVLRQQVLALLEGGNAHMKLHDAVKDFPPESYNIIPINLKYSFWHLLEHIRLTQEDILKFVIDPQYKSPEWPVGYWPAPDTKTDEKMWQHTIQQIENDLAGVKALVMDSAIDLTAPIVHAPGYNVLREALLVADHNAYHIGEFGILRQVMNLWPKDHDYFY